MGIAWETGYLLCLADGGIDTRIADLVVGTSAGSQVGLLIAAGIPWDDIWKIMIGSDHQLLEATPSGSLGWLFERYDEIATSSKTPEEWFGDLILV